MWDIYEVSEGEEKTLGETCLNTVLSQTFYLWTLTILLRVWLVGDYVPVSKSKNQKPAEALG